MRVLALDAATEACSVALLDGDRLYSRHEEFGKSHADRLLAMVDEVLAEAALGLSALDGIAACIGPGAFTGVRITVAVAQGLGFGATLPIVPVSTLETLALQLLLAIPDTPRVLACLDARMGEVYWGCYAADPVRGVRTTAAARVSAPDEVSLAERAPHRGIGRGFSAYPALSELPGLNIGDADRLALPSAPALARLGALRLLAGEARDPEDFAPLYLRDRVALTEAERALK